MSSNTVAAERGSLPSSLNDADMAEFQRLAMSAAGIDINESKRSMIYTRFIRRLRALRLTTFSEYLALLQNDKCAEYETFINTVTTNLTYFFREPHHFEYLSEIVIPEVYRQHRGASPVRFWSAGCSSGEEPHSIAIMLAESAKVGGIDYRLLCTDIDSEMVKRTASGDFTADHTRGLERSHIADWFEEHADKSISAKATLQAGIICKQLNLFDAWPIRAGIEVIFCRNVLIYFDRPHQDKIIRKFANMQSPGHYLFLGHSESLRGFDDVYKRVSNTVYKRQ
ncbi:MAG: protein-glutamate O-methyltransferase CheR [Gammaproteobacteria bacterium]